MFLRCIDPTHRPFLDQPFPFAGFKDGQYRLRTTVSLPSCALKEINTFHECLLTEVDFISHRSSLLRRIVALGRVLILLGEEGCLCMNSLQLSYIRSILPGQEQRSVQEAFFFKLPISSRPAEHSPTMLVHSTLINNFIKCSSQTTPNPSLHIISQVLRVLPTCWKPKPSNVFLCTMP